MTFKKNSAFQDFVTVCALSDIAVIHFSLEQERLVSVW